MGSYSDKNKEQGVRDKEQEPDEEATKQAIYKNKTYKTEKRREIQKTYGNKYLGRYNRSRRRQADT